ncbi:mercuric transporter MerT family protein [Hymenobacter siberiensis]|nr:mercuric transporter MerT family protein [Hymenobacter siberiensis]
MNNAPAQPSKSLFGAGLLAALAASLCCITPLLAVVGGLGGAASSFAWLEPYRLYLVALTVAVLGFAWYRQLRPVPAAADCCAVPAHRSFMQSTGFLASVTVLAALLLAFPYYGAKLYPTTRPSVPVASTTDAAPIWQTRTYRIEGMTCEACAHHVEGGAASPRRAICGRFLRPGHRPGALQQRPSPGRPGRKRHQRYRLSRPEPNPLTSP